MKLAIFATHPVQYHTALWRALAAVAGLDVHVFYFSDQSVRGGLDPGFGVPVAWDVPLLKGYPYTFLSRNADISKPWGVGLSDARGLLTKGQFDWVLLQGYTHRFERQILRVAKALGIGVLLRAEFSDLSPGSRGKAMLREIYLRWFYRQVDAFCSIGQSADEHLIRRGVKESEIYFSPYHVDSAFFAQQAAHFNREVCREALGVGANSFVLLFSGKLIPRKAPSLLLEAIGQLGSCETVELIMVGNGPLKELVEGEGKALLGGRLHAPGFVNQSELGRYFAASDLHVLPSSYETWGLVVNEAMYFGLPSIVSDRVGCHPDLVIHDETGYVFKSGNAHDLAEKIEMARSERAKTLAMGMKARELVTHYSTEAARDGILRALGCTLGQDG